MWVIDRCCWVSYNGSISPSLHFSKRSTDIMYRYTFVLSSSIILLSLVSADRNNIIGDRSVESWISKTNFSTLVEVSFNVSMCCNVYVSGKLNLIIINGKMLINNDFLIRWIDSYGKSFQRIRKNISVRVRRYEQDLRLCWILHDLYFSRQTSSWYVNASYQKKKIFQFEN